MPWNNQNGGGGGGWKSGGSGGGGGGGPWGQGPQGPWGGGQQQPDLEEILKRSQDKLRNAMPGGGLPASLWFLVIAGAAVVLGWYAFTFTIKPNEQGLVLRFGKYERQAGPGLHFKWPYPVEEVLKPDVTRQNKIEIGMRSIAASRRGRSVSERDVPEESLMLTGDENIVDVDFEVQWQISDAEKYSFNIQNPQTTVKEVAEAAMREIVGKSNIQPLMTDERIKAQEAVLELMQGTLDAYRSGIRITQVLLKPVDPPEKVIAAFQDVQAAKTDQDRIKNEATAYANRVVPEARGQAERILQAAQGYRQQAIAEAKGQAGRFLKVYQEYKKAPEVTRRRMFLETMERVFAGTDKIILDSKGGSGVVPYLPLNELTKKSKGAQ